MEELPIGRVAPPPFWRQRLHFSIASRQRSAIRRGLMGESKAWQVVAILLVARIALRRIGAGKTVYRARLDIGDRLEIRGVRAGAP